jgi:hypothetical protein
MKTPVLILAIATVAAAAGAVDASSTFHPSNDEGGTTVHVVPGTISRAEREALDRAQAQNADSNWVFRGEEAGWELSPHSFDVRAGRLVHTDRIPHDIPAPTKDSAADPSPYRSLERD